MRRWHVPARVVVLLEDLLGRPDHKIPAGIELWRHEKRALNAACIRGWATVIMRTASVGGVEVAAPDHLVLTEEGRKVAEGIQKDGISTDDLDRWAIEFAAARERVRQEVA
jgi:hypothetical protein